MVVWHAVQACGQIHICIFNSHKRWKYPWLTWIWMALRDTVTPVRGQKENEEESNLKKNQTNQPFRPLHSTTCSRVTGVHREPDISLLWSLTTTNQSLLAMEQLSALRSIGEGRTSNPCSSVSMSPKITTNASVVKRLFVKRREQGFTFFTSWDHIAMPRQAQSLELQGWSSTSRRYKAWIFVITSTYFKAVCVGWSLPN